MKSLAVVSQKGGVGKSTICLNLAVQAMLAGRRVSIIDTDPQRSLGEWFDARESDEPSVTFAAPDEVARILGLPRSRAQDAFFVDSAPRASAAITKLVAASDCALIPIRPGAFDVATGEATVRIVQAAGKPFVFVLNECEPRMREVTIAREALAQLGDVLDVEISHRRVYSRSLLSGRAVVEFDPDSDAAAEIRRAWDEITRRFDV